MVIDCAIPGAVIENEFGQEIPLNDDRQVYALTLTSDELGTGLVEMLDACGVPSSWDFRASRRSAPVPNAATYYVTPRGNKAWWEMAARISVLKPETLRLLSLERKLPDTVLEGEEAVRLFADLERLAPEEYRIGGQGITRIRLRPGHRKSEMAAVIVHMPRWLRDSPAMKRLLAHLEKPLRQHLRWRLGSSCA